MTRTLSLIDLSEGCAARVDTRASLLKLHEVVHLSEFAFQFFQRGIIVVIEIGGFSVLLVQSRHYFHLEVFIRNSATDLQKLER